MVMSKDITVGTWSKCCRKFAKLMMTAQITDLRGKITMLVTFSHKPQKGQCSCKHTIQTVLITTSGTINHNCSVKDGFCYTQIHQQESSISGWSGGGTLRAKPHYHQYHCIKFWILHNLGEGERRDRLILHLCGTNQSLRSFHTYLLTTSCHGLTASSPSLGLTDHSSWLHTLLYNLPLK
jgi:hypothetical protein